MRAGGSEGVLGAGLLGSLRAYYGETEAQDKGDRLFRVRLERSSRDPK